MRNVVYIPGEGVAGCQPLLCPQFAPCSLIITDLQILEYNLTLNRGSLYFKCLTQIKPFISGIICLGFIICKIILHLCCHNSDRNIKWDNICQSVLENDQKGTIITNITNTVIKCVCVFSAKNKKIITMLHTCFCLFGFVL